MYCPKCKNEISENDLVCPNCKKVIKLLCQNCGNVTKNSTCEKCGTVLLNKCYKCSRFNPTELSCCPSCGLNMDASIGLRESIIEEFAVLIIDIANLDDIKSAFNSEKIKEKFKQNLYTLIKKVTSQKKLRVQMIGDTFIIRFCKDYSFSDSCKSALDFSIYVAQSVTEINEKLFEAKGVALKVQMVVQKRDVYARQDEYKSGLNINVVYSSSGRTYLFNNLEVAVDSYVYQETKTEYPFLSLSAIRVKNQMVMFFELVLQKLINTKRDKDEEVNIDLIKLPKMIDFEPDETVDDSILIDFKTLHCSFLTARNDALVDKIKQIMEHNIDNPIINIVSDIRNGKMSGLPIETFEKIFYDSKVVRFSLPETLKYEPYGFFKKLILAYRNISELELMLNPSYIDAVTMSAPLRSLFFAESPMNLHPEDSRVSFYEEFESFIHSITQKTLFVIDDFDNIDESSLDILKYIIENKMLGNVGFVISCDEKYYLHRKIYKLMTLNNYYEIKLKPTSNKSIVAKYLKSLKNINRSFFVEKILENTKGSLFYFQQALEYMLDKGIFTFENGVYKISNDKMVVLPNSIDSLISKRILSLSQSNEVYLFFVIMLLIDETIPLQVLSKLGFEKQDDIIKQLVARKFVKRIDKNNIYINNYNICRKCVIELLDKDDIKKVILNLFDKLYGKIEQISRVKAELLELACEKKEAFSQWHSLAVLSSKLGDFCAYLYCTNRFLALVEDAIDLDSNDKVEQVKMDVYLELTSLIYKFYPQKIINMLEKLLNTYEQLEEDAKVKEIANKLVQACITSGNYKHALEYIGKIFSRITQSSFDTDSKNFNLSYFLLNLVTVEIYFNLGRLNECVELGKELFASFDASMVSEKLLPEDFSKQEFNDVIFDSQFYICLAKLISLEDCSFSECLKAFCQNSQCFELFKLFERFLRGEDILQDLSLVAQNGLNDKYSKILFPLIQAMISLVYKDWHNFANYLYNAKTQAVEINFYQMKLFCEVMIAYAYNNLGNNKKAKQMYLNISDISADKGFKQISYLCWLLQAKLEFKEGNIEIANNIIKNMSVSMEKDDNVSLYLLMHFKIFNAELMFSLSNMEQALFSLEQAYEIACAQNLKLHLPMVGNMLLFVYNTLLSTDISDNDKKYYQNKIVNVESYLKNVVGIQL